MIRSKIFCRLLCLVLACALLGGCAALPGDAGKTEGTTVPTTEATEPPPTAPADGDPSNVTAKGSYFGTVSATAPVATVGDAALTGDMLQLYYGLTVSTWRAEGAQPAPDWSLALDVQECPLEGDAITWQQFFLQRALDTWHMHAALIAHSATAAMELDPEYEPNLKNHETYLKDTMPAMKVLYGKDPSYKLNDLNKAFMDSIPDLLTRLGGADALAKALGGATVAGPDLEALAERLNEAYAYFIWARRQAFPEEETAVSGDTVTFRHVLLIPGEEGWDACEQKAQELLKEFLKQKKADEPRFAVLANQNSMDEGSRLNGGLYEYVARGQMNAALDAWLFDPARTPGETAVLRSDLGVHILWFSGDDAAPDRTAIGEALIREAMEQFPMTVRYTDILLEKDPESDLTFTDLLYPDIAHEYVTDYPLFLQQDFPHTMYGNFPLVTYGCGITTLAMFASYMADEILTPPELARRYGHYCFHNGTDAALITDSAPELGYFVHWRGFDWRILNEHMVEGYEAMCLQHKGYFTRGGHYLILRQLNEDGSISIRDSNIYNYGKLHPHDDDCFKWGHVTPAGAMYWSFENKITRIPACSRCGGETGLSAPEGLLLSDYTCGRCLDAIARTDDFLNHFG